MTGWQPNTPVIIALVVSALLGWSRPSSAAPDVAAPSTKSTKSTKSSTPPTAAGSPQATAIPPAAGRVEAAPPGNETVQQQEHAQPEDKARNPDAIGHQTFSNGERTTVVTYVHTYPEPIESYPTVWWAGTRYYNVHGNFVFWSPFYGGWSYYWGPPMGLAWAWNWYYPWAPFYWGVGFYGGGWYWGGVGLYGWHAWGVRPTHYHHHHQDAYPNRTRPVQHGRQVSPQGGVPGTSADKASSARANSPAANLGLTHRPSATHQPVPNPSADGASPSTPRTRVITANTLSAAPASPNSHARPGGFTSRPSESTVASSFASQRGFPAPGSSGAAPGATYRPNLSQPAIPAWGANPGGSSIPSPGFSAGGRQGGGYVPPAGGFSASPRPTHSAPAGGYTRNPVRDGGFSSGGGGYRGGPGGFSGGGPRGGGFSGGGGYRGGPGGFSGGGPRGGGFSGGGGGGFRGGPGGFSGGGGGGGGFRGGGGPSGGGARPR